MRRGKVLWRLLGGLLALSLVAAACGGDDDDDTSATTEAGTETTAGGTETTGATGPVETGPGVTEDTITLGVVTPQTGAAAVIGNPLTAGNQVFFDALNAQGGVAGQYQVNLTVVDSQYQPPTAVQQYNAIKGDVAAFVQVLGTAVTQAILPQLSTDNILASPASLDAFWLVEEQLLPIGGPYQVQAINALTWYYEQAGNEGKKLCTMAQDDPYGEAGVAGVQAFADGAGIEIGAQTTFRQGDADFTAQIQQLQGDGCEVVWLVSLPLETGGILGKALGVGFAPQWIGQSPTWITRLGESPLADYLTTNFLLASEGGAWGDESIPGMAQMIADVEQYAPDQQPDIYFAFGYAQAWAMTQVLERAIEMGSLSREGIMAAAETEQELSYEDLIGTQTYGLPDVRNPSRQTTIFKVDLAAPGYLAAAGPDSINFTSPAAEDYQFEE